MKVLIVHNRYRSSSPGGEDRVVDQEAEALAARGHDVHHLERRSDDIDAFSLGGKARVPLAMLWSGRAAGDLRDAVTRLRPDVVHVHNLFPLLSPSVLATCERQRIPCVVTFHNYQQVCPSGTLYRSGASCHDCVGRRVAAPAVRHGCYHESRIASAPLVASLAVHRGLWQRVPSAYLFLSETHRQALFPAGLPESRCFVKPNLAFPVDRRGPPEPLVTYLGRLTEAKGIRTLMAAWDCFAGGGGTRGLHLAIAGSGPLAGDLAAWAHGRPGIELHGLLDRQECTRLVQRSAAVVVPSEWEEPFGLVVVEAMAAGVPPVAPSHGAFPELVSDGVDGMLYPPGDSVALAGVLQRIAASPAWAAALGARARHTYVRRFAPSPVISQLETVYQFAVAHPRWAEASLRLDKEGAAGPTGAAGTVGTPRIAPTGQKDDAGHWVQAAASHSPMTPVEAP